jgi:2'-5' RNA ligase
LAADVIPDSDLKTPSFADVTGHQIGEQPSIPDIMAFWPYMPSPLYALVAYVRHPVGEFVENLRRELHPEHPDWPGHITVLPPRSLSGTEAEAVQLIEDVCEKVGPFDIAMGDAETFAPTTPTVFIRVAHAAYRMRELHDHLNTGPLFLKEPWPYMPHLTIVKLQDVAAAQRTLEISRERWRDYHGSRRLTIDSVTFVREGSHGSEWLDLNSVPLGRKLAYK